MIHRLDLDFFCCLLLLMSITLSIRRYAVEALRRVCPFSFCILIYCKLNFVLNAAIHEEVGKVLVIKLMS